MTKKFTEYTPADYLEAYESELIAETLLEVQKECLRLQAEVCQLQAERDYLLGWIAKQQEALEKPREVLKSRRGSR